MIISVAEGGTLALTQQLTHFNALGSVIPNGSPPFNPFAAQNGVRPHLHHQVMFLLFQFMNQIFIFLLSTTGLFTDGTLSFTSAMLIKSPIISVLYNPDERMLVCSFYIHLIIIERFPLFWH